MAPISRRGFITLATGVASVAVVAPAAAATPRTGAARSSPAASLDAVSLTIDNFRADAADRWTPATTAGTVPTLAFSDAMTLAWPAEPAGTTVSATRTVTGIDCSGYRSLQITVPAADRAAHPTVVLTATDGSLHMVRFSGPGTRVLPVAPGWVQLTATLPDTSRETLARIAQITVGVMPVGGHAGRLRVQDISLLGSRGFSGPTTFVDPALSTYAGRDWTDVAARIHDQGFTAVHLIVLDFGTDLSPMVDAFHTVGMLVALTIFPTTNFQAYDAHPEWRQLSLGGESAYSWRVYLSPTNPDFVAWLQGQVSRLMRTYAFDGFTLDEPWYEVWGGPYKDNPEHQYYMDISAGARQAFEKQYAYDPLPTLFVTDTDGTYSLDPIMAGSTQYQQWVRFRIDTISAFMAGLADVVRTANPRLPVFLTYVADVTVPGGAGKTPEYQAQDLDSMQVAVHPAGIIIESAWQDWLQPDLPPDYVLDYTNAYVPQLHPGVIGLGQPDIGSVIKRNMAWLKDFSGYSWQGGFSGYVIYEWSIGDWPTGGPPL